MFQYLSSLAIILFALATTGCPGLIRTSPTTTTSEPVPAAAFELSNVDIPASNAEIKLFHNDIVRLVKSRDFEGLDAMAARFREGKERFIGGGWKIRSFYRELSAPWDAPVTDKEWKGRLDLLRAWKTTRPRSITARCALLSAYVEYAWFARGDTYAKDVPAAAWPVVHERVDLATEEVKGIEDPDADPYGYFESLLRLATIGEWDRASFDKAFASAVAHDPTYQYFYSSKAVYLLPRWNGVPGEWEQFAAQTKQDIGGEAGLKMYYFITADVSDFFGSEFFDANHVSWADLKQGFQLAAKEFGTTSFRMNQFGALTFEARDPQATCKTFSFITSQDFDPTIWKDQESFESRRKMAQMLCRFPRADNMRK